jgi:hypothetical protein
MQRLSILALAAVIATVAGVIPALTTTTPAGATASSPSPAPVPTTEPVTGSLTDGTARIVFFTDPSCPNGELFDLTGTGNVAPFGAGDLVLHICDRRRAGGVLDSSFTFTGASGSVSGTVATYGVVALPPPEVATFHIELTIASGTGRFTSPTGTIVLDGALHNPPSPQVTATASGAVTFTEPPAKQHCHRHHDRRRWHHRGHGHWHRAHAHAWHRSHHAHRCAPR